MSREKLTVVLSQAQGKNPAKRALEESLAAALIMEPGLDVSIVPYLYDLDAKHTGRLFLESVNGDMAVLAWMFPRAAFWLLDRDGIKGHYGESQLKPPGTGEDEDEDGEPEPPNGIGTVDVPDRHIYCLDLRNFNGHEPYITEIRRIAVKCRERREAKLKLRAGGVSPPMPTMVQLGRNLRANATPSSSPPSGGNGNGEGEPHFAAKQLLQQPDRRWYPVIDYSRCTNCMECIDFCLFGVYGVDKLDRILVENQDNCKRGCPACSRVCPEHAIMFPEHKTPAIAGAPVGAISGLKIDLSKLFGGGDAMQIAATERDRELISDGREAASIPQRQTSKPEGPKDDLDKLMDSLDALDI